MESGIEAKINKLLRQESAYSADAYRFISSAVTFTVSRLQRHRHVTALELLKGIKLYAREEFGVVAHIVLREFGIYSASDVGRIVYLLIGEGVLASSADDDPEDFNIDFDLNPSADCREELPPLAGVPYIDKECVELE